MMSLRRHLTYANVAATLALALAMGGTGAYAGGLVTSEHIKNGTIKNADIHKNAIRADKLANSALARSYANGNGSLNLNTTSTVVDLTIPAPGDYVITAKTILNNNSTSSGVQVTCTLYGDSSPMDASVTSLAVKATVGGPNASTDSISVMGLRTFTAAGTAELQCDSGGSSVTAADSVITAIKTP